MNIVRKIKQVFKKKNPQHCKQSVPKIKYSDSSWIDKGVTPDQERIEKFLLEQGISGKRILQVGSGDSSFAKKFAPSNSIDSITIMEEELQFGNSLALPNYTIFEINKYSADLLKLTGDYDYIIDNNISSFACCRFHFEEMMKNYVKLLKTGGSILSDEKGMSYFESYAFPIGIDELNAKYPFLKATLQGCIVEIKAAK